MSGEAERIRNGGNGKGGKVREQRAEKQGRGSAEHFQMVSMCGAAELSGAELAPGGCGWILMRKVLR